MSFATSANTPTLVSPTMVEASRPPTTSSTPSATPTGPLVDPRLAGSSACGAPRSTGGSSNSPPFLSLPARPRSCPPPRRPRTSSATQPLQEEVDALPDGSPRPPTKLYVDNQAAIASAYNPEHHGKLKHVERRHFYIREAIEAHRLCVPFVRSDANLADFFTKPLKPKRFFELRDKIMNIKSPVMNITFPNAS